MKLQDDIDFTTLNWVKQELDETLKQARQALEAYVEDPADTSLMRFCATYLHQVQGTLRMVELYGAAMVVEEMERVALGLLDGQIKPHDETYSILMRGIVQLPDYLERLQSGHKDIPIVLLPLLNDLRATRGEKLLTESVLFSPDLSAPLPQGADGAATGLSQQDLRAEAARLRTAFQLSLLRWIRGESPEQHLQRLSAILDQLRAACTQDDARRLWWIATGVLESVAAGVLEANAAVKLLFGKIDREIKRLVDAGETSFGVTPPRDLTKNLLYYIAHSSSHGTRAEEIRQLYRLDKLLPSEKELAHAKGSISGHNRTLLDTVSAAIKDDLLRVKEALDIFLRAHSNDPGELGAQADVLDRVGDTLGMLGLGVPRRVVLEQRQIVQDIASKSRAADESTLLDVAGALLYVEASLDDHISRLGAETTEPEGAPGLELPKAEVRRILDALMKEASVNIAQAKQDIVAFVESPWDHARVEQIPRLLEEISGALRMLDLEDPARLMTGIVRFVEIELLRHRRVPTVEQMDKLADALASIEYYIEATREQRGGRDQILDVTRKSLEALGYWPVPDDDGGGGGSSAHDTPHVDSPSGVPVNSPRVEVPAPTPVMRVVPTTPVSSEFAVAKAMEFDPAQLPAMESEFPQWNENIPASGGASLKLDPEQATAGDSTQFPSIELPDEGIDAFLQHLDQLDHAGAMTAAVDTPITTHEIEEHVDQNSIDMHSAVDIAPGRGIEDLLIGEAKTHEPPMHDLSGLRLAETEATLPPSVRYVEVEEEIEEEVPDVDEAGAFADATFHTTTSDEIDAEIREVFIEEVQEEIENLNRYLPIWRSDANDFEKLKPIRRSFHTLKGSGRLVGALALGDFSWKIENMLNRVLDKTIMPSPAVQTLCGQAVEVLPELLEALRGAGTPKSDLAAIMNASEKLAAGEETWVKTSAAPRMKKVRRIVRKLVPVVDPAPVIQAPLASTSAVELTDIVDLSFARGLEPEAQNEAVFESADTAMMAGVSPLANVDPVLYEILKSEVAAHLAIVDEYVQQAQTQTPPAVASEPLLRAVHTLNGAIAMVDIPAITQVLAPLEGYIKRLRARNTAPNAAGLLALAESSTLVRETIDALDAAHAHISDPAALSARIVELRDALPDVELMHTLFASVEEAEAPLAHESSAHETAADANSATVVEAPAADTDAMIDALIAGEIAPETLSDPAGDEAGASHSSARDAHDEEAALLEALQAMQMEVPGLPAAAAESGLDSDVLHAPVASEQQVNASVDDDLTASWLKELEDQETHKQAELIAAERAKDAEREAAEAVRAAEAARADVARMEADYARRIAQENAQAAADAAVIAQQLETERLLEASSADAKTHVVADEFASDYALSATVEPLEKADAGDLGKQQAAPAVTSTRAEREEQALIDLPPLADDLQPDGKLELPEMDEDLLEIFVQEGEDILDHCDSLMARLRESPQDREMVTGLQRDLHTLKGGARMAGLAPIGDLSHAMESLLEAIIENRRLMDRVTVESLERGFDRLHGLVQRIAHHQAIAMPANAIARFEGLVSGDLPVARSATVATNDAVAASSFDAPVSEPEVDDSTVFDLDPIEPIVAEPAPVAVVKPTGRPGPRALPNFEEEDAQTRAPQEMIRVRSDLLDSLVNYAGEVSIYRSRLEQQISTFRFNLVEFEQTVSRLRDQLRKLEMETEAQILSRYQREGHTSGDTSFDPLELDRFSQLQQLSRALAESVSDLTSIQGLLDDLTRQSETLLLQQSRVSSDLQEGLMRTRMVPFDSLVPSLRRTVRQAAQEVGKRAQLKVEGAQGEMDRNLLERMKAPFEHMLRNALAHGIEGPDERLTAGKPTEGTVSIHVSREATEVVLRVSDDGRGLDREAIRRKAIERGLLNPEVQLSDRDLYGFIIETGFSTAETVTQLSGRGVGMDVVHNEIKQLGGSLAIDSTHGKGTSFIVRLPFTLAVTQAILVRLGEATYAVPMSSVQGVVRIAREDLDRRMNRPDPNYTYAGEDYLIYELSTLVNVMPSRNLEETQLPLLMTRTGDQRAAVRIDGVIGSREIVVKSVGPQISSVPGIFGATIMGDGSVVMILDLAPLVRRSAALRARVAAGEAPEMPVRPPPTPAVEERRQPLIMVVDDSITMRKVTTRVLERNDMEVITAKDGLDAVEKLQDKVPDVVLLDVEMPRMDGYELATYMKNDARLKLVPIIMITSRTGEKHRQRALEIGVERYLGKPYQEADLLRNLLETLKLSRA